MRNEEAVSSAPDVREYRQIAGIARRSSWQRGRVELSVRARCRQSRSSQAQYKGKQKTTISTGQVNIKCRKTHLKDEWVGDDGVEVRVENKLG